MAELLELQKLQDSACDPKIDETCDLSEIIEALKGLSEMDDPFAQLRNVQYWHVVMANILYGLVPIIMWVVPVSVYFAYGK